MFALAVCSVDLSYLFEQNSRFILELRCLIILVGQAGERWRGKKICCVLEQHNRGRRHPALL